MNKVTTEHTITRYLVAIFLVITLFLIIRNTGLYPTVFADEYIYSKFTRLTSLREVSIPGYLYFSTYKLTTFCGDGFLGCVRILNVFFFVAAAPFIYLIGKKLTGSKTALLIATLSILGPINTYTAYFMPESFYFLSFWIFTYLVFNIDADSSYLRWSLMGVIFGASALIKPHALFLVPALAIYFLIVLRQSALSKVNIFQYHKYFTFFVTAISVKLLFGFALAGASGITLFGVSYTSYASGTIGAGHYISLAKLALENLQGHILSLSILFSVPIAQLILTPKLVLRNDSYYRFQVNLALYTLLTLFFLLIVVALFTASVSGSSVYESNARLHMRYYNFSFPLLLLVAASQLAPHQGGTSIRLKAIIGLLIGVAIIYAGYTQLNDYKPSFVDNPELRGFTLKRPVFYVLSGMSLVSLALWVYAGQLGAKVFLYLFMPLAVCFSSFYVNQELRQRLVTDVFDRAGIFTKQYLPNADISNVVVVGSEPAGLFRSLFFLDNPKASLEVISQGAAYDLSKVPSDKQWVLLVGADPLPDTVLFQMKMNGFTLIRVPGSNSIDFKRESWPGFIASIRGLSTAESWGTWSESDVVTFEFLMPLPDKFNVHLVARAFGPNIGKEFEARVGDSSAKFTLGDAVEGQVIALDNPKRAKTLSIKVPYPISPKELGLSGDERRLGIAFFEMRIAPL